MQRKHHSAEFKAKVALEALKGDKTINEIAGANQVHPNQVSNWKRKRRRVWSSCFLPNGVGKSRRRKARRRRYTVKSDVSK